MGVMKNLLLLCTLITLCFSQTTYIKWKRPSARIAKGALFTSKVVIGGNNAVINQIPFQASILASSGTNQWFCGGSIIHASWILTAAHCVDGATSATLRFGTLNPLAGGTERTAALFIPHPAYDPNTLHDDIALIRISTPLTIPSDSIQKVDILPKNLTCSNGLRSFQASGWGITSDGGTSISNALKFTKLNEITDQDCMKLYGPALITPTEICAFGGGTTSICSGDSGGPLVTLVGSTCYLAGVTSFAAAASCVQYPNGFVETTPYLDWIRFATGIQTF